MVTSQLNKSFSMKYKIRLPCADAFPFVNVKCIYTNINKYERFCNVGNCCKCMPEIVNELFRISVILCNKSYSYDFKLQMCNFKRQFLGTI